VYGGKNARTGTTYLRVEINETRVELKYKYTEARREGKKFCINSILFFCLFDQFVCGEEIGGSGFHGFFFHSFFLRVEFYK